MHRILSMIKQRVLRFRETQLVPKKGQQANTSTLDGPKTETHNRTGAGPDSHTAPSLTRNRAITAQNSNTLPIVLRNNTNSSNVYCYITGQAINNGYAVFLLQADGQTPYYPRSPDRIGSPLAVNCGIPMGGPGSQRTITIPRLAGGRIWFSIDAPLTFLLNPGQTPSDRPGLVEPSISNTADPNYNINWGFAEFTYNEYQMYANISFVDFVSIPISLTLTGADGSTQTVQGLPGNGLQDICNRLRDQSNRDGQRGWANLIFSGSSGRPLRALSPNVGRLLNPNDFTDYYDPYVDRVLARYRSNRLNLDINEKFTGGTSNDTFVIGNQTFSRPTTGDIFSSNSGPFTTGPDQLRNRMIPQLAAAFNRSSLLVSDQMPSPRSAYYQDGITNHYSRIVHEVVAGGKGYAFPYDDVPPSDGGDQSGYVNDGSPRSMMVTVGGF